MAPWTSSGRSSRGIRDLQMLGVVPSQLGSERSGKEEAEECGPVPPQSTERLSHKPVSAVHESAFCSWSACLQAPDYQKHLYAEESGGEDSIPFLGHLPAWKYQGLSVVPHAQPQGLYNLIVHRGRTILGGAAPKFTLWGKAMSCCCPRA